LGSSLVLIRAAPKDAGSCVTFDAQQY